MENNEKKLTIDEIAKMCGVSKASISRYLNGKFENLSPATREKIKSVIAETNYRPNRSAQRLKAAHTKLIGCIIGDVSSPFSAILLHGITDVCDRAGYQILIADCGDDSEREKTAIEDFLENRVDGLIVNTSGGNDELLIAVHNSGIPVVLADRGLMTDGKLDYVASSNRQSAKECVAHLKECGYEKIAFFSEEMKTITTRLRRLEGYMDGLREYYSDDAAPCIYEFRSHDEADCTEKLKAFLEKYTDRRTAILSVNGVACQYILLAAQTLGIQFGREVGLCSFDDWTWLRLAPPGITSVKLNTEYMGSEAARLLLEQINGERPEGIGPVYIETPGSIVKRGSTQK